TSALGVARNKIANGKINGPNNHTKANTGGSARMECNLAGTPKIGVNVTKASAAAVGGKVSMTQCTEEKGRMQVEVLVVTRGPIAALKKTSTNGSRITG